MIRKTAALALAAAAAILAAPNASAATYQPADGVSVTFGSCHRTIELVLTPPANSGPDAFTQYIVKWDGEQIATEGWGAGVDDRYRFVRKHMASGSEHTLVVRANGERVVRHIFRPC